MTTAHDKISFPSSSCYETSSSLTIAIMTKKISTVISIFFFNHFTGSMFGFTSSKDMEPHIGILPTLAREQNGRHHATSGRPCNWPTEDRDDRFFNLLGPSPADYP